MGELKVEQKDSKYERLQSFAQLAGEYYVQELKKEAPDGEVLDVIWRSGLIGENQPDLVLGLLNGLGTKMAPGVKRLLVERVCLLNTDPPLSPINRGLVFEAENYLQKLKELQRGKTAA